MFVVFRYSWIGDFGCGFLITTYKVKLNPFFSSGNLFIFDNYDFDLLGNNYLFNLVVFLHPFLKLHKCKLDRYFKNR